jgi:hypothetical protein
LGVYIPKPKVVDVRVTGDGDFADNCARVPPEMTHLSTTALAAVLVWPCRCLRKRRCLRGRGLLRKHLLTHLLSRSVALTFEW